MGDKYSYEPKCPAEDFFIPGDRVRVCDASGFEKQMTEGWVYTVGKVKNNHVYLEGVLWAGRSIGFNPERFVLDATNERPTWRVELAATGERLNSQGLVESVE